MSNVVSNGSSASYQYTVNPSQSPVTKNISSNLVSTQINNANVTLTKSTNKQFATIGETISYTILITNSGNTSATNVQLTDPLPNGTILNPGTVTLNGVLQNVDSRRLTYWHNSWWSYFYPLFPSNSHQYYRPKPYH